MSALRLINETEITSGVAQVNITDVFSADFDIYKITVSDLNSAGSIGANLRFINTSDSSITSSIYDFANLNMRFFTSFAEARTSNNDDWDDWFGNSGTGTDNAQGVGYIFNPFDSSSYTFGIWQSTQPTRWHKKIGVLKQTSSISGFAFFTNDGHNFSSGLVRTYGLRVDS